MIRAILYKEIGKAVKEVFGKEVDFDVSWDGVHADYSSNIPVILGLDFKDGERLLSELLNSKKIKEYVDKIDWGMQESEPRFLNFRLSEKGLEEGIKFTQKERFDFAPKENKVQVEFISANPTGQLHIGHGRDAFYGDALANILDYSDYEVEREYYINDAKESTQIKELGKTVLGEGEMYLDDYLRTKIKDLKFESKDEGKAGYLMAQEIQKDNKKFIEDELKIKFDNWFSEDREIYEKGEVDDALKVLRKKDLYYEKDGATWFRTSKYGDDEDRVLIRSDGTQSYFLADIAYHINKFEKTGYDKVIDIWGADHQGHVKRMQAAKKALGWKGELDILVGQLVALKEGGIVKRLSKRKGDIVWLKDLVKEVGLDAARWFFLEKGIATHVEFDMDLAKEHSKKNPVYYVQYAGARMSSILEKSKIKNQKSKLQIKIQNLSQPTERALILKLIQFPEVIKDISKDYQVHHLTTYIYELAKTFTNFYENVRVLDEEDEKIKEARLTLVADSRKILERALGLLGISAPHKM